MGMKTTRFETAARKVERMIAAIPAGTEADALKASKAWQALSFILEIRGDETAFARISAIGVALRAAKEARLENEAIGRYFELKEVNTRCMEKMLRTGRG